MTAFIIRRLHLDAGRSIIALILAVFLLTALMTGVVPSTLLYSWSGALLLLLVSRLYDLGEFRRHSKENPQKIQLDLCYHRFRAKAYLTAFLLGIVSWLFTPYIQDSHHQLILFFFIVGISAGALAALFPDKSLLRTYLLLLNLPLFIYFISRKDPYAFIIAMILVYYVFILLMLAKISRRLLLQTSIQERELQAKERELHALFEQTPIPIFYFDSQLRVRKFNRAFSGFFNIPPDRNLENFDLKQLRDRDAVAFMQKVLQTRQALEYDGHYRSTFYPKDYWFLAKAAPLFDREDRLIGGIVSFQDKTTEKESIEKLEDLATHDQLTGLGNRRMFLRTLAQTTREPRSHGQITLLFFIDLDQFKPINDALGHHAGDRVLHRVAQLLRSIPPQNAEAFRHGGDEFVLLLPLCCASKEEAQSTGRTLVKRLNQALADEIVIDGYHLPMRSSVGIVVIDGQTLDPDEIVRQADIAMYQAKNSDQCLAFYDTALDQMRQQSFHLRQRMQRSQMIDELELLYQPIVSLHDGKIMGAEALVRWRHPSQGLLGPNEFIPLAIESGEIGRIGRWVAQEACRVLAEIQERFDPGVLKYLSFNVDARELNYEDFAGYVESLIRHYRIPAEALILEITENTLIDNFAAIEETIKRLHDMGVRWAIDDFGVGYSSLSYLERLSFDILKIDRTFVDSVKTPKTHSRLIDHIIDIADTLKYRVIIEGVEKEEQIQRLRQAFPQILVQGYYFSRPLDKAAFFRLLERPSTTLPDHSPHQGS